MKPKRLVVVRFRQDRNKWEVDHANPPGVWPARSRKLFETEAEATEYAAKVAKRLEAGAPPKGDPTMTLGAAFERYFLAKARKRSLAEDRRIAEHLKASFGKDTRLRAACADSDNLCLLAIVTIALETGMRYGEIMGMEWDRVDLSRGVIRLELTKSGRRREVPMRQAVYDVLAALPGPRQGRVWRLQNIRTAFENAVAAARIDNLHFHDLRHSFASWFMMRGGQLQTLKEILGHADLKMTLRYAHLAPEHLRSEMLKTEQPTERSGSFSTRSTQSAPDEVVSS